MNTLHAAVEAFAGAIESARGEMKNRIVNPRGAYCRAVLPLQEEVQRRDVLHHGAALRMNARAVEVVPYVFRQVCSNGALWAHSAAAFSLRIDDATTEAEIADFVASSTDTAASTATFRSCLEEVRTGLHTRTDMAISTLSILKTLGSEFEGVVLEMLLRGLPRDDRGTRYDAMNVVTAAAREVPDPELKWRMESLATRLLIGADIERKALPSLRERRRDLELAGV
jgi:hypothetical protein